MSKKKPSKKHKDVDLTSLYEPLGLPELTTDWLKFVPVTDPIRGLSLKVSLPTMCEGAEILDPNEIKMVIDYLKSFLGFVRSRELVES